MGGLVPEIRIYMTDSFGKVVDMVDTLMPTVVAFTGDDTSSSILQKSSSDTTISGTWQDGTYIFSCLQFKEQPEGLVRIQFMAIDSKAAGAPFSGINQLRTGFVTVTSSVTANYGLRFSSANSLFIYPGQPSSAVLNVALPPITIELVDSLYVADTSNNDVVIVATTSSGQLDANGAREIVTKGKAVFSTLKFISIGDEPILTFKAQSASQPVGGKSITTGSLTLTTLPIASFEIAFMSSTDGNNDVTHEFQAFTFASLLDVRIRTVVMVRDSAHQYESSSLGTLEMTQSSDEAVVEVKKVSFVGQSANFTTTFSDWISDSTRGAAIYVKYVVTSGSNPLLLGKTLTIGPIKVESSSTHAACSSVLSSPVVVGEFRTPIETFSPNLTRSSIAYLMGVEANRVKFANIRKVKGVDHSTVAQWTGTKVDVSFLDPLTTSTNRKSSSQLASELVELHPGCNTGDLNVAAFYLKEHDNGCDPEAFNVAVNYSAVCAIASSTSDDKCACYLSKLFDVWGTKCSTDEDVHANFVVVCGEVASCQKPKMTEICTVVLSGEESSLAWVWVVSFVLLAVVLLLLALKYQGLICVKKAVTLRKSLR